VKAGIAIMVNGEAVLTGDSSFENLLRDQAEAFLSACLAEYLGPNTLCPKHAQFIVPTSIMEDMYQVCGDEIDERIEQAVAEAYVRDVNGFVTKTEIHDHVRYKLDANHGKYWNSIGTPKAVEGLLTKEYGCKLVHKRIGDIRVRGFEGISKKAYVPPVHEKASDIRSFGPPVDPTEKELDAMWGEN
jgi:hypothetical protein